MAAPISTLQAPRRASRLTLRLVADRAGLGSFVTRAVRERNLYGSLAFAETAESMRLCQEALHIEAGDRVAGICSSGDMLLSMAAHGAADVVGFDVNPTQVALARFKAVAIRHLGVEEYLELFGVASASPRWRLQTFDRLTRDLPAPTRRLLLARRGWVPKGILNHGMTHLIIRSLMAVVERLVDEDTHALFLGEHGTDAERAARFDALAARPVTRYALTPFAQRFAPQLKWLFFPHKLCRVSDRPDEMVGDFFEFFRPLFVRGARDNPVLARSTVGHVHEEWTRHLYDEGCFARIEQRAEHVRFEPGDLVTGFRKLPGGWATKLYLSNAPDYLTNAELDALVAEVRRVAAPGARVLHFSLLDEDRIGDAIGRPADDQAAIRASDNVHLYPAIAVRVMP